MCGYNCTRSFLFVLSLFFTLVGGALTGVGIYALVYELIFDKHFLDSYFEKAESHGFPQEQKERIVLYFLVVTSVSIGLGFFMFVTGITGLLGACQSFKSTNRYGDRKSSIGPFAFFTVVILLLTGFVAAWILYVGVDGKADEKETTVGATKSPDFKLHWKPLDLQVTANQIYEDLAEFVLKICDSLLSKQEAEAFVTNALFLTGGVICAVVVLIVIWLIVACCVSCCVLPADAEYLYVSPEKKRYDDWVRS